ncbi:hypothetical protein C351_03884 [Cryptococcus neoformans c8]|nr:hypothetical protein C351_03884 [Cryptococcus neoformans var. grubii c8]
MRWGSHSMRSMDTDDHGSATKIARINVVIDKAFQAWPPVMASDELDSLASSGMPAASRPVFNNDLMGEDISNWSSPVVAASKYCPG